MQRLLGEIKRRRLPRVVIAYAIATWALLQGGDVLIGLLGLPEWTGRALVGITVVGLPVAVILAWIYDWTPSGIVVTDKKIDDQPDEWRFQAPAPLDVTTINQMPLRPGKLVGRESECALLQDQLKQARAGKGSLVLIGGEPGVGKSHLALEAVRRARDMGMLSMIGHAYEERGAPLVTATECLEDVTRALPEEELRNVLGNTAPEIAKILPELRLTFPAIQQPLDVPPEQQQRFFFNAVTTFLERLSQAAPLVLMIDDFHWADDSSVLLLEHLYPQLARLPILVLATYRDVEADMGAPFKRVLTKFARQSDVVRIGLKQLSVAEVTALIQTLSGAAPPEGIAEAVHAETNGNAFFVQSVFESLADEGRLFDSSGAWLSDIDAASLAVPESVRLAIGNRIARLSQPAQTLLHHAAVIGLRFQLPLLEAMNAQKDSMLDALEEIETAHLIQETTAGDELRYEFVHALARQSVLASLSSPRRQRLHAKAASAIESLGTDYANRQAAKLTFHLAESGARVSTSKSRHWLQVAGQRAAATAAFEEAADLFSQALSLDDGEDSAGWFDEAPSPDSIGPSESRASLLQARGSARLSLGQTEACLNDLQDALTIYESLESEDKAVAVVAQIAYILVWTAEPRRAEQQISGMLERMPSDQSSGRCRLLSAHGLSLAMAGDLDRAAEPHDTAISIGRNLREPDLLAEALQNHALSQWLQLGGSAQADSGHEGAMLRENAGEGWAQTQCLWMEKAGLVFQGNFEQAQQVGSELDELAEQHGDFGALGCSALMSSTICQAQGDLIESSRHMRKSIDYFEAGGFPWGYISEGHYSVNALLMGEHQRARESFELAQTHALVGVSWSGADLCYWLSGKAHLGDEDVLEAYQAHRSILPTPGTTMASGAVLFLEGCIEALLVAGHDEQAAALYPTMNEFVQSKKSVVAFTYGLHERFAAMAAAAGRQWQLAEAHYDHTLKLAETLPHRVDQARVRYWYARMLLGRQNAGDLDRANDFLDESFSLCQQMGMDGLKQAVENARQSAG